jgi:hypothetical protein
MAIWEGLEKPCNIGRSLCLSRRGMWSWNPSARPATRQGRGHHQKSHLFHFGQFCIVLSLSITKFMGCYIRCFYDDASKCHLRVKKNCGASNLSHMFPFKITCYSYLWKEVWKSNFRFTDLWKSLKSLSKEVSQQRGLTAKRSHSKEVSQQRNFTA